ncbi:MAG: hypothetical protein AAGA45_07070, partial [Verrucomicrobiota bacterium]
MQEPSPFRLQKISMIVADVLLITVGILYAFSGDGPMSPLQALVVTFCITLGGALAFIPFYLEYKNKINLQAFESAQGGAETAQRVALLQAELRELSEAVAQIADRSEQSLTHIDALALRIEETAAKKEPGHGRDLNALQASVNELKADVAKALETTTTTDDTAALIGGIEVTLSSLTQQLEQVQFDLAKLAAASLPAAVPASEAEPEEEPEPASPGSVPEPVKEPIAQVVEEPKPIKKDKPRPPNGIKEPVQSEAPSDKLEVEKSVLEPEPGNPVFTDQREDEMTTEEELSAAQLAELEEFGDIDLTVDEPADTPEESIEPVADNPAEAIALEEPANEAQPELMADLPPPSKKPKRAKKSTNTTTLVAEVLIGIGNKPFVRGVGPGLSETEGVPMDFVEIGKWQWTAPANDVPVTLEIYKNDET